LSLSACNLQLRTNTTKKPGQTRGRGIIVKPPAIKRTLRLLKAERDQSAADADIERQTQKIDRLTRANADLIQERNQLQDRLRHAQEGIAVRCAQGGTVVPSLFPDLR
jgi:small-conductance mechanosensitive channel